MLPGSKDQAGAAPAFQGGVHDFLRSKNIVLPRPASPWSLANEWGHWLGARAEWHHFVTLTYGDEHVPSYGVTVARFQGNFSGLLRVLNEQMFGRHYRDVVKRSYFPFVMGLEFQQRRVLHAHLVAGSWIDYQLIHDWWNKVAGFAFIEHIVPGSAGYVAACEYVCKYAMKGGVLAASSEIWLPRKLKTPRGPLPLWWRSSV